MNTNTMETKKPTREEIYDKLAATETEAWIAGTSAVRGLNLDDVPPYKMDPTTHNRHPDSQRFHQLLAELGKLHDRKQSTYGRPYSPFSNYLSSQELGIPPWRYVVARVCEKMSRLQSFAKTGNHNFDQTARELKDISACSLIAIVLMEKE